MKSKFQRVLGRCLCNAVSLLLPTKFKQWGDALRVEVESIANDDEALRFALGGGCGLLPRIMLAHFQTVLLALSGSDHASGGAAAMGSSFNSFHHPRLVGMLSAAIAVLLGLGYMAAAGAPIVMLASNLGALLLGLAVLALSGRITMIAERWVGVGTLIMASILLVTSMFGNSVEGAKRWVLIGPFFIQTSLLFLPLMVINFARIRNALATVGMVAAAAAFALQPDRAMAAVLAMGLIGCALYRFDRFVAIALLGAGGAFFVTLLRADTLPAVPYVDKILYTAFDVHFLAGAAVVGGAAILLAPAIVARMSHNAEPEPYGVFGAVWLAIILAAAIGNYPTPVVGYGSSAIIGYLLSLSALPKNVRSAPRRAVEGVNARDQKGSRRLLRTGSISLASVLTF